MADACTSRITPLPTSQFTNAIVAGDFNGDGKLDLAISVSGGYGVCAANTPPCSGTLILLGNGDGTFQDPNPPTGPPLHFAKLNGVIAAGDFNGDGKTDLSDGAHVAFSRGDGTFSDPVDLMTGVIIGQVSAADMNGDGRIDLVVASTVPNTGASTLNVLVSNGDGTFKAPISYPLSSSPNSVAFSVGDLDADGRPDVVVTIAAGATSNTFLYLNNGDGRLRLSPATMPLVPFTGGAAVVGDFNGDHIPDLIVVSGTYSDVYIGQGNLVFGAPTRLIPTAVVPASGYASGAAIVDWYGDGKPDVLLAVEQYGVVVFRGNGDGTFQPAALLPGSSGGHLLAANLSADTLPDVVTWSNGRYLSQAQAQINTPKACVDVATTSSNAAPASGTTITLTTTVKAASGSGSPAGTVTYTLSSSTPTTITAPLTNGQATAVLNADLLDRGNSIGVLYSGDAVFDANNLTALTQAGPVIVPTVLVSVVPANPTSLQPLSATITVTSPSTASPAGTTYLGVDGNLYQLSGNIDASGAVAIPLPAGFSPGSHVLTASYNGNDKISPGQATTTFTVTGPAVTTTTTLNCSSPVAVSWAVCTAQVASPSTDIATGTVTLLQDGAAVGTATLHGYGNPTYANFYTGLTSSVTSDAPWSPPPHAGAHTMTVSFAGTSGFSNSTASYSVTIPRDPTSVTLTSLDSLPAYVGSTVHLRVQANYSDYQGLPSPFGGTITILDGSTQVTSIPITAANLQADFSMTSFSAGTHTLTAQYTGSQDYAPSTSTPLVVTIVPPPDFAITNTGAPSASLRQGQSTTVTFNLAPSGGFSGAVTFSCAGLPDLATCSFNPATVTSLSAATMVAVTIKTTGPFALNRVPRRSPFATWPGWTTLALGLGLLVVMPRNSRRRGTLLLVALLAVASLTSCGGGGTQVAPTPPPTPSTPAGSSQVTITAASGQTSHAITFILTVTN